MPTIDVDGVRFQFDDTWTVSQYDSWAFYRKHFGRIRDGIKALDLIALDPAQTVWLVEVKDYRTHPRTKPSDLADEIAQKVIDTLAAMLPARVNAADTDEQQVAMKVLAAQRLRVVLHLEQPARHSALRPRAINPADVQQKLRRLLKPVDAHPQVVEARHMSSLNWTVELT